MKFNEICKLIFGVKLRAGINPYVPWLNLVYYVYLFRPTTLSDIHMIEILKRKDKPHLKNRPKQLQKFVKFFTHMKLIAEKTLFKHQCCSSTCEISLNVLVYFENLFFPFKHREMSTCNVISAHVDWCINSSILTGIKDQKNP